MLCGKCNLDWSNNQDSIKCSVCKVSFHPLCTRIKNIDLFKKMNAETKKSWKCDECMNRLKTSCTESETQVSESSLILKAIENLKEENRTSLNNITIRLDTLDNNIASLDKKFEALKVDIDGIKESQQISDQKIKKLESENQELRSTVNNLNIKVLELDQYSRVCNMLIEGIPATTNENLPFMLGRLCEAIGLAWDPRVVSTAHRLPRRAGDDRPPTIIVQFVSRATKAAWMAARRSGPRLSSTVLAPGLPEHPIYFNDHLTYHTRTIFNAARESVKQKILFAVQMRDGKVFVKRREGERYVIARSVQDVQNDLQQKQAHCCEDKTLQSM